ncbi:MAG: S1 family peptidase [Archangium sp.]
MRFVALLLAILGGDAAPTESSVFLLDLRFDSSASICSAVLVSPRVLLTAAHCVDPAFHSANSLTVRAINKADASMLMQSDAIEVTMINRHPQWNASEQESAFDVATLLLARAPVGVLIPPRVAAVSGSTLELFGYGRTSVNAGSTSGVRRVASTPMTALRAAEFEFGSSGGVGICSGDSGGPSFLNGGVVGIHSRTESSSCGSGVDMRVDVQAWFIEAFIAANDPPLCSADGRCSSGCDDPDCPVVEVPDAGVAPGPHDAGVADVEPVSGGCASAPVSSLLAVFFVLRRPQRRRGT